MADKTPHLEHDFIYSFLTSLVFNSFNVIFFFQSANIEIEFKLDLFRLAMIFCDISLNYCQTVKLFLGKFRFLFYLNLFRQKYRRLRCLLCVKGLVICFFGELVWQNSSFQTKCNKGRFKVMASCLQQ